MQTTRLKIAGLLTIALVGVLATVWSSDAAAQQRPRDAGSKARGEIYRFYVNGRAGRSTQHARNHARDFYRYSREAVTVAPDVAKTESELLGQSIASAEQDVKESRKQYVNDPETMKCLDTIEKHLAAAQQMHEQLHGECCKQAPDVDAATHCCSGIVTELDKAAVEHAALTRTLEQRATKERNDIKK